MWGRGHSMSPCPSAKPKPETSLDASELLDFKGPVQTTGTPKVSLCEDCWLLPMTLGREAARRGP